MSGRIVDFPERPPVAMCEGGCGPAEYLDPEDVPLCAECYDALPKFDTETQMRAYELGLSIVPDATPNDQAAGVQENDDGP